MRRPLWIAAIALLVTVVLAGLGFWHMYGDAFGVPANARDIEQLSDSPQWDAKEEVFTNPDPMWMNTTVWATIKAYREQSDFVAPKDVAKDIPQATPASTDLISESKSGIKVTWFGHSSMYIQVDGARFLIDPVWHESSPVPWIGPARWFEPSLDLSQLPVPDAVLISHDHFDHLDYRSILEIKDWDTTFVAPLGVGAHLRMWGVDPAKVVELDWNQEQSIAGARVVCLPSRHASGRGVLDQNATLWSGWGLLGPEHKVYYSGDTGLFDGMKAIGTAYGPFDLAMIEVGQYHPNWPDWHLGPEQAVLAAQWTRSQRMLPVHWGAFTLAMHSWTAPVERTLIAAKKIGMPILVPKASDPIDALGELPEPWWPRDIPFLSAEEQPVMANRANGRPAHPG